jgi:hypothetical protein
MNNYGQQGYTPEVIEQARDQQEQECRPEPIPPEPFECEGVCGFRCDGLFVPAM